MQKQVPLWLSSIIIIVVLVLSAFVITSVQINSGLPENKAQIVETTQQAYVAMPSRPPQYLAKNKTIN